MSNPDEVDDGYKDEDDEDFNQGHNLDYDNNLCQAQDNGCDHDHLPVIVVMGMMVMMLMM